LKFGIQKGAGASYFKGIVTPSLITWIEIIGLAAVAVLLSWLLDQAVNRGKRRDDHALPRSGIFWRV